MPFGLARGMVYLQDEINATRSKGHVDDGCRRVERTQGAVVGEDEQFRQEVARPDADIILDPKAMREGGIFKVSTDLELTQQQFQRLADEERLFGESGNLL